jgi:membrane protease subunit HflK
MPWSNNGGGGGPKRGPWGSGDNNNPWGGGGRNNGGGGSGGSGGGGGQGPNIEDFFKRGQDQLKGALGQGGGGGGGFGLLFVLVLAAGAWLYASFYTVKPDEQAVVLTFGEYTRTDEQGLNFAPWPVQTAEIVRVTAEQVIEVGGERASLRGGAVREQGLMLTGDENIVDINFQVVWNINALDKFLFNIASPAETIQAVAESAMREVVGQSKLQPLLNRDRAALSASVEELIQVTLDDYEAGINIIRVNLDRVDPPDPVRPSFLEVQAAEQERDKLQNEAQAYYNRKTAEARGAAAQILEEAQGYKAQVVAEAEGEAQRFKAVLEEYANAPEVTRRRLYIETMERVLGDIDKILIDENVGGQNGQGVVQYLPLDQLGRRNAANQR